MPGVRPGFAAAVGITVWLAGLLIALMLGMETAPDLPWQAALVRDADISWISVNSSKPGRPATTSFVVHSTNTWADEHFDDSIDAIRAYMLEQFASVTGIDESRLCHIDLHLDRTRIGGKRRRRA